MNLLIFFFIGPVFGYQDYFNGLAIIMDTYANKIGHHTVIKFFFIFNKIFFIEKIYLAFVSIYISCSK